MISIARCPTRLRRDEEARRDQLLHHAVRMVASSEQLAQLLALEDRARVLRRHQVTERLARQLAFLRRILRASARVLRERTADAAERLVRLRVSCGKDGRAGPTASTR